VKHLALLVLVGCASTPAPSAPSNRAAPTGRQVALVVVMNSWELFAGNTQLVKQGEPDYFEGVIPAIDAEAEKLRHIGAGNSVAAFVTYHDRAKLVKPFGPLAAIGPGWFGTQKDYYMSVGVELLAGVELAIETLAKAPPGFERVILVLGDGCDTNPEAAKTRVKQLAVTDIAVHEIRIATKLSAENCNVLAPVAKLDGTALTAGFDQFVSAFR
jgi:hypothetical protein